MESVDETKAVTERIVGARGSEETTLPPSERNTTGIREDGVPSGGPSSPTVPVSQLSVEEARKHRKRTLDALYAQRKRDCQRFEKEQLEETVGGLEGNNRVLKQDNERLEALLRQAQAQVVVTEQERAGIYRGVNDATLSQSYQQENPLQPYPSVGLPAQQQQDRAHRRGNPQDQEISVLAQEQLLALLGALLQGNTAPASAGTASFNFSQLSSILKLDGQQSAGSQVSTTPQDQETPEAALAAAHQQQQQLLQFLKLHSSESSTNTASAPAATLTPAFTVSSRRPQGSASALAATTATASASRPFQQPQPPTPQDRNHSQISALGSVIENILSTHVEGSARNQPALHQHQQLQLLQQQQQQQQQTPQQQQQQQQQQQALQQQTPAVDLKALASLLDPQTRAALVSWNQTHTSQTSNELGSFPEFVEQQHHRQQQISPFQLPVPVPSIQRADSRTQYSSSDSMLQGQLASLQAVLKLQQQQQQFQQQKWQEEERYRVRQQKLAQQQQQWIHQQVPHHPYNPQIISEHSAITTTPTPTSAQTPNSMAHILAMVAVLQSQSSYPSR